MDWKLLEDMDCVSYTTVFLKPVQCMTYIYVASISEGIISMKCKTRGMEWNIWIQVQIITTNVTFLEVTSKWKQVLEISICFFLKKLKFFGCISMWLNVCKGQTLWNRDGRCATMYHYAFPQIAQSSVNVDSHLYPRITISQVWFSLLMRWHREKWIRHPLLVFYSNSGKRTF